MKMEGFGRLSVPIILAAFVAGCMQLESPKVLTEEEDLRVRSKNLIQTREELKEQMLKDQKHIKRLQSELHLTVTREEALTIQLKEKQISIVGLDKDLNDCKSEIAKKGNELQALKKRVAELQDSLAAEQNRASAADEVLRMESGRMGEIWLAVDRAVAQRQKLELEETKLNDEIGSCRERIWEAGKLLEEAEKKLAMDREKLKELKNRIEEFLGEKN